MARSKIEWLARPETIPASWNPVTGCGKISLGCRFCYAEHMARRLSGRYGYPEIPNHFDVTLRPDRLEQPLRWRKPRTVFVNSMSDFFHPAIPISFQFQILQVIGNCPQHTFLILTKRTDQMEMWDYACGWHPYPNLWLGVSAENQEMADKRIPILLQMPAGVLRFVSLEPLLGAINIESYLYEGLTWVIVGSESGPGARPMKLDWVRHIRDQCQEANVPFFFKQRLINGKKISLPELDGKVWNEWPQ